MQILAYICLGIATELNGCSLIQYYDFFYLFSFKSLNVASLIFKTQILDDMKK